MIYFTFNHHVGILFSVIFQLINLQVDIRSPTDKHIGGEKEREREGGTEENRERIYRILTYSTPSIEQ